MRAAFFVLTSLALASAPLAAQQMEHPQGGAPMKMREGEKGLPPVFEGIALTDAQKAKVAEINKTAHARMDAARAEHEKAMKVMMDKEHAEFRAALTPDQQATFDKNLAKHMKMEHGAGMKMGEGMKMGGGMMAPRGPKPPAR